MLQFIAPPMPHFIVGGEDTYPPGRSHPSRANIGIFDLLFVTEGALFLEENDVRVTLEAGQYLILRPDAIHRTVKPCEEKTHFYWLHFQTLGHWTEVTERQPFIQSQSTDPYARIEMFSFYIPKLAQLSEELRVALLIRRILQLQSESSAEAKWMQQTAFQELLLALQEEGGRSAKSRRFHIAEAAARYLRNHYKEEISYEQLTKAVHFHENYISLCMKNTFGCTPLQYLTQYRIEQAKQMLVRTNEPIGAIAEASGFGSFPYFVRCFVKQTGMRPNDFRKRHR